MGQERDPALDYVAFEARVEPVEWGRAVYTVLPVPDSVMAELGHPARVEAEIAEHPVNLAPQKAPVIDGAFLWAGKALLTRIGARAGDVIQVRLRVANPDAVEVPPDVALAIRGAGQMAAWETLTPGRKRGMLHGVEAAKRAETRARRIAALVAGLAP